MTRLGSKTGEVREKGCPVYACILKGYRVAHRIPKPTPNSLTYRAVDARIVTSSLACSIHLPPGPVDQATLLNTPPPAPYSAADRSPHRTGYSRPVFR